jgi:hypothetical protein
MPSPVSGRAPSAISASPVVIPMRSASSPSASSRVADGERRADRPLGVVLVGDRRPEHGHDGVADELLHRPAAAVELGAQARVERSDEPPLVLRVHFERHGPSDRVPKHPSDVCPSAKRTALRAQ